MAETVDRCAGRCCFNVDVDGCGDDCHDDGCDRGGQTDFCSVVMVALAATAVTMVIIMAPAGVSHATPVAGPCTKATKARGKVAACSCGSGETRAHIKHQSYQCWFGHSDPQNTCNANRGKHCDREAQACHILAGIWEPVGMHVTSFGNYHRSIASHACDTGARVWEVMKLQYSDGRQQACDMVAQVWGV